MRHFLFILGMVVCAGFLIFAAAAQQPDDKNKSKDFSDSPLVVKMMEFNKKKDGKLTKDEVTDRRLHRLFDLADANKDGVVTREELMAIAAKMDADWGPGPGGGPKGKGPKGKGPKGPKQ